MIDLSVIQLKSTDYKKFISMCNDIYDYIKNSDNVNLFELYTKFNFESDKLYDVALSELRKNNSIYNGSKGYVIGVPPEYTGYENCLLNENVLDNPHPSEIMKNDCEDCDNYVPELIEIELRISEILTSDNIYHP